MLVFSHEDVVKPEEGYLIYKLVKFGKKINKTLLSNWKKKLNFNGIYIIDFLDIDDRIVEAIPTLKENQVTKPNAYSLFKLLSIFAVVFVSYIIKERLIAQHFLQIPYHFFTKTSHTKNKLFYLKILSITERGRVTIKVGFNNSVLQKS